MLRFPTADNYGRYSAAICAQTRTTHITSSYPFAMLAFAEAAADFRRNGAGPKSESRAIGTGVGTCKCTYVCTSTCTSHCISGTELIPILLGAVNLFAIN